MPNNETRQSLAPRRAFMFLKMDYAGCEVAVQIGRRIPAAGRIGLHGAGFLARFLESAGRGCASRARSISLRPFRAASRTARAILSLGACFSTSPMVRRA